MLPVWGSVIDLRKIVSRRPVRRSLGEVGSRRFKQINAAGTGLFVLDARLILTERLKQAYIINVDLESNFILEFQSGPAKPVISNLRC